MLFSPDFLEMFEVKFQDPVRSHSLVQCPRLAVTSSSLELLKAVEGRPAPCLARSTSLEALNTFHCLGRPDDQGYPEDDGFKIQVRQCTFVQATAPLLEEDSSLWCVSSWNDNGLGVLNWSPNKLVSHVLCQIWQSS